MNGFTREGFEPVRLAFDDNFAGGAEIGASFCMTVEGETVVDIWGGFADAEQARPWQRDTIVNVYSSTKTMTALTALLVADRGELDVDAPVARYWPEFAANGKADVTVGHLLSHSAGLPDWEEPLRETDLYDWDKMTSLLAAQPPAWKPGTASGYHALTQGYLVGEVVRRVTGRSVGTVFREEIAEPLGADFHIGLPESEDGRVAELVASDPLERALQRLPSGNPPLEVSVTRTRAWRGAEIPAAGGTGNARSMAEIHAILANGGVAKGHRFMSEAGCRRALEPQVDGRDRVLDMDLQFGLGFAVSRGMMPNPNTLWWGGLGGSLVIVDLDARTTMAYAMNRMTTTTTGDLRGFGMAMTAWEVMGLL